MEPPPFGHFRKQSSRKAPSDAGIHVDQLHRTTFSPGPCLSRGWELCRFREDTSRSVGIGSVQSSLCLSRTSAADHEDTSCRCDPSDQPMLTVSGKRVTVQGRSEVSRAFDFIRKYLLRRVELESLTSESEGVNGTPSNLMKPRLLAQSSF